MAIRTLCSDRRPDTMPMHKFLCKLFMLLTIGSIYTKVRDFVKLDLNFMTMWI